MNRHICDNLCQPARELYLLAIALHAFLQFALQLVGICQQVRDASELLYKLRGGFLSYAGTSWNVVCRITHQPKDIYHLFWSLYAPLRTDLIGAEDIEARAHRLRFELPHMGRHQLSVVLVWSHHIRIDSSDLSLRRQRSYDIVCLVAFHLQHGNAVCRKDFLDDRHPETNGLGGLIALRLIEGIALMAERTAVRIEGDSYMRGLFLCQHIFQRVEETEDGRDILPTAVDPRVLDETVVRTIDECIGIEQK